MAKPVNGWLILRDIVITRLEKAVARWVPEGGANLKRVQEAVAELRTGRSVIAKRRGYKPLSDSEINDATYLELAVRRKFPMASRDEALRKAAKNCRVKLLL
jgi:hypothetical protein